jgi:hypothetical protein
MSAPRGFGSGNANHLLVMASLRSSQENGRCCERPGGGLARSRALVFVIVLVVSFMYIGTLDRAIGQLQHEEFVTIYGRVQWISGGKMIVSADCQALQTNCSAATAVAIDLVRVDQSDYRGVTSGTWVIVEAFVRHENAGHRIIATSIRQVEEWRGP